MGPIRSGWLHGGGMVQGMGSCNRGSAVWRLALLMIVALPLTGLPPVPAPVWAAETPTPPPPPQTASRPVTPRTLTLYGGDKQGPYVCHGPGQPGLVAERVIEAFRRIGITTRLDCTAWNRAQQVVKTDPDGIILNLARTPEREDAHVWLLRTGVATYGLATLLRPLPSLPAALQAGSVAVVRGTPRAAELLAIGPPERVVQVNDPAQAARLLRSGRVEAWYETPGRIEREWADLDGSPLPPVFTPVRVVSGYVAAGRGLADAEAIQAALTQAAEGMKKDGTWAAIADRYPADPP